MKNKLIGLLLLCLFLKGVSAQVITGVYGAEAGMLAGNSVTLNNCFSIFNNPAAITLLKSAQYGVFGERKFNQREMNLSALAATVPLGRITAGLGMAYYGFSAYNVQRYSFGCAVRLMEKLSLGIQGNYAQMSIAQYGQSARVFWSVGLLSQPVRALQLGFVIINPQQAAPAQEGLTVPSMARVGARYRQGALGYFGEVQLETGSSASVKGGLSYQVAPAFLLAAGVANGLSKLAFGTMFTYAKFRFEVSCLVHQYLGAYPQLSLVYPPAPAL